MAANEGKILPLPPQAAMTEAPHIAVQSPGDKAIRQIGFAQAVDDVVKLRGTGYLPEILPKQFGNGGMFLQTDGSNASWANVQTIRMYAKNNTGGTLTRGQAVYVNGASGTNILITKAQANAESTSSKTIGLVETDTVAANDFCWVVTEGILYNVNTGTGADGDTVWLSPDTAGGLVYGLSSKPKAPNHMVFIGYVVRANANVGEIYVKPQNGFELEELHNVQILTTPSNDQVLAYETATSLWKPKSIVTGVSSVTASSPIASSGGSTPNISLTGTVPVANGGTGAATLTGYVKGSGTSAFTASSTIPGSDISGDISGNSANVTGTVAIAKGGTGQTTANTALNALLPSQSTYGGYYLKTDGTNTSWAAVSGGGGDVTGPSSSAVDAIALFSSTTGKAIKESIVTIDASGNIQNAAKVDSGWVSSPIVWAKSTSGEPYIRIYQDPAVSSYYVGLKTSSTAMSGSQTYRLPTSDGTSGQVLKTDGGANLSFGNVAVDNVSGLGTGVATFLATPSSANLASAVTDETGSGKLVFADTTTAPTADKVLKWNGSTWVPGSLTNTTEFQFLVTSFTVSPSALQEIGSGVWKAAGALSFTAAYQNNSGMTAASIQISGTGVTAWTSALSLSSPYTSGTSSQATNYPTPSSGSYRSITFTITATRGSETPTRTATVSFGNNRFWGVSTTASGYTEAIVEGLANTELTTSRAKTSFTTTAAAGNYVIYATPSLLGTATFVDNTTGFAFSMTAPESVTVTNTSGYSETYYVYRSTYSGLGAVDVKVS